MKGLSPTQRTLRALRERGCICGITERFNSFIKIRQDLFGFIDLIALDPARGIIGVQCCGKGAHAAHKTKILENEIAPEWLKAGGKIEIWSWDKRKLFRGSKAERWEARMEEITKESFGVDN